MVHAPIAIGAHEPLLVCETHQGATQVAISY